jgi:hypothetical protein
MMGHSETLTSTHFVFITLQVHAVAGPFTSHHKKEHTWRAKTILLTLTGRL